MEDSSRLILKIRINRIKYIIRRYCNLTLVQHLKKIHNIKTIQLLLFECYLAPISSIRYDKSVHNHKTTKDV